MTNHIVMWSFHEEIDLSERKKLELQIKEGLEGLINKIPGVIEIKVIINELDSSTHDLCMISSFENIDALKAYQKNDEHLKVASIVRACTCNRACMDYESK